MGGNLLQADAWTKSLPTNPEVIAVDQNSTANRPVIASDDAIVCSRARSLATTPTSPFLTLATRDKLSTLNGGNSVSESRATNCATSAAKGSGLCCVDQRRFESARLGSFPRLSVALAWKFREPDLARFPGCRVVGEPSLKNGADRVLHASAGICLRDSKFIMPILLNCWPKRKTTG